MLIGHTGDLHIKDGGVVTLEEQAEVLGGIGDPGFVSLLVAGDVFDAASTPAERNTAIEVFTRWADLHPVIIVRGNHDRPGDLQFLARLRTKHMIHVAEGFEIYKTQHCNYILMPWPNRARVAAWLPEPDRLKVDAAAGYAVRALIRGAKATVTGQTDDPLIFVGHLEIGEATMDSGQPIAGHCDIDVALDDLLELEAEYYALGHIHKPQTLDGRVRYAGSPRQMSFGEAAGHGYSVYNTVTKEITHVELPSPQFTTVDAEWDGTGLRMNPPSGLLVGDPVRLRYTAPESERAQAREAAERFAAEFTRCKLEPKILIGDREHRSEIRAAITPADKLRSYWQSKDATPERAETILQKLNVLHS